MLNLSRETIFDADPNFVMAGGRKTAVALHVQITREPAMSYSWRSILKGVQVLKKGIIWRVGNGGNIRIWKDPWIKEWTRLPSRPRGTNLQQTIDELVDPVLGTWDEQLVRQTFCHEDPEMILAIPVHTDMDDCVAWHYDTKGVFSVKSAYKVQMEDNRRKSRRGVQGTSTGCALQKEHWAGIWSLNCPGKIKHFLWRLAHNSLAVRMNLARRGMDLDTRCVMCNRLNEDCAHLLFKCKLAKHLWRELGLEGKRQHLTGLQSAEDIIKAILNMAKRDQMYVCVILYQWWKERNNVREGDRRQKCQFFMYFG